MEQRRSSRDTCGKGVIMIRVNQLKLPIEHSEEMLRRQIIKTLHLKNEKDLIRYQIRKQSIDARKKNELSFVYTVDVELKQEGMILHKNKNSNISKAKDIHYHSTQMNDN